MDTTTVIAAYETENGAWYCPTHASQAPAGKHRVVSMSEAELRCNENADDECEVCGECVFDMANRASRHIRHDR